MSLTSKQIDELRAYAADRKGELAKMINDAADTIEMLSAKLSAYMTPVDLFPDLTDEEKKASRDYAQGYTDAFKDTSQKWIPCSETVDIPDHEIMACDKYGEEMFGYLAYEDDQWICESDGYVMCDPIAWCEKPEPYREEGKNR